eukprot:COSAG02_NODE_422_length_22587_cov_10.209089_2_plen_70_part_00
MTGLVAHFEAERQQGTFDVIKSVEENLYLVESTMEDKTNELERILYSSIGALQHCSRQWMSSMNSLDCR